MKTGVMKWLKKKNSQQNFTRQGYMLTFESRTLLLWAIVTLLRNRDVIHRGSASFGYMIHVPVLIIIPASSYNPTHCVCFVCRMVRVFANGPGDLGSISGRVIPKTQKMVLDVTLLNAQHYKVRIMGKVKQSRERGSVLHYTLVW